MYDLEFAFVYDLIFLAVPFLVVSLILNLMKYVLGCAVHHPHYRVSRETKKPVKSWCYDE